MGKASWWSWANDSKEYDNESYADHVARINAQAPAAAPSGDLPCPTCGRSGPQLKPYINNQPGPEWAKHAPCSVCGH